MTMEARSHEIIAPTGQDVTLAGGQIITVKPITVGQLPRFVKAIRPAFGALVALAPATSSPEAAGGQGAGDTTDTTELDPVELLDLYAEHGPAINEAITICTGMKAEAVDSLQLDEAFSLLQALWTVNRDFFVHRVLPMLGRGK